MYPDTELFWITNIITNLESHTIPVKKLLSAKVTCDMDVLIRKIVKREMEAMMQRISTFTSSVVICSVSESWSFHELSGIKPQAIGHNDSFTAWQVL